MATTALKKITAEAKRIRKKKPKTTWKSAVRQAGAKYRSGKIRKPKKVGKVKKKRAAKKRSVRKKAAPKKAARKRSSRKPTKAIQVVKVVRVTRVGRVSSPRRKRMAGSGGGGFKKFMPFLLLGGAALILWHIMKPKAPQVPAGAPPLIQTTNQSRNQQTNEILQYALAGGLALDAITKLINALNSRSDTDIRDVYDEVNQGGGLPPTLFV